METTKGVYTYEYPRPSVTTDCVIFGYDVKEGLSVLLIERGIEPYKGRWAFPGGFLRMDETTEAGALRELKEETGYTAGSMRYLTRSYTSCGYSDEVLYAYLCTDLTAGETDFDENEALDTEEHDIDELVNMVMSGEINDAKTQIALMIVKRMIDMGELEGYLKK